MSVQKELIIKVTDHHKLVLLTGINAIPNTITLQIRYQDSILGVALGPEYLKAVIESLEEVYYKLDLLDEPAQKLTIIEDKPQPDYVKEIEKLKDCLSKADQMYADVVDKNRELMSTLNEKEAYIGSLIANLKAETDNVTQLRANIKLGKHKSKKDSIKKMQEIEAIAEQVENDLKEVQSVLKKVVIERDEYQEKFHNSEKELIKIKTSGGVFTEGIEVYSHGLNLVAKERLKHFNLGRTIEKDVVTYRNNSIGLFYAAMFYLDLDIYKDIYPKSWDDKREKILSKPFEERVKIAASLLIAHLDMKQYIEFQNNTQNRRG